jgi:hypothetical protein
MHSAQGTHDLCRIPNYIVMSVPAKHTEAAVSGHLAILPSFVSLPLLLACIFFEITSASRDTNILKRARLVLGDSCP